MNHAVKVSLKIAGAIFVFSTILIGAYFLYLINKPVDPPGRIPIEVLTDGNKKWEKHMLNGEGAYYSHSTEYEPPISSEEDWFGQSIDTATYGKSAIIIRSEYFHPGYMIMEGGPLDIVKGETTEYVLYGKEVGQTYMPYRLSFDDAYQFSHADFYLIRRDAKTKKGVIVKEWLNTKNSSGHLLYDDKTRTITVDLCSIGVEEILVNDILEKKDSGHNETNIICHFDTD